MKTDEVIKRSIYIITEYYKNNLNPFFESISDDILWLGPAQRQKIQGRQNLISTWANENHTLTFTMGNIKAMCVSPGTHVREVLLQYEIYTHFPSGYTDCHEQRLHYTWHEKRTKTESGWESHVEIVMLHISNLWQYDSRDVIYPIHYENLKAPRQTPERPEQFVTEKTADAGVHRIAVSHILYIETLKRSAKLIMHTKSDEVIINETMPGIEAKYPGVFVRIHAGYLINPAHVREIRRFSVTLSDGTVLPVPEKRYTDIKNKLLGWKI